MEQQRRHLRVFRRPAAVHDVISIVFALVLSCCSVNTAQQQPEAATNHGIPDIGSRRILNAPFTLEKRFSNRQKTGQHISVRSIAAEEMKLCDTMVGCAGVTFSFDDLHDRRQILTSEGNSNADVLLKKSLQVHLHNFLPSALSTMDTRSDQILDHIGTLEREITESDGDLSSLGDTSKNIFTYQSKKDYIFHRGRIVADVLDEHRRTVPLIGLDEAKRMCKEDSNCIAFTFSTRPSAAEEVHISTAENVTFFSMVPSIDREGRATDEWRSYISSAPDSHAGSVDSSNVNASNITIHERELDQPYATKRCCTRRDPLPTLEELGRVDQMPRISCNISKEEFRALYETPRLPVILEGCDSGWPASSKWNRKTLSERFDNETTFVGIFHNRRVDLDNYESWGWIKDAMATGEEYYVFDSLIAHPEVSKLQHDFELPAPIENIYLKMEDFPPGYGPSRWFTYGSRGSGTRPHLDPIAADAWNYVARGYKWWVLFPRGEEMNYGNLYCAHDCSTEMWNADHWFAEVGVNAGFNEYDGMNPYKRPVHVLQKPGEVLYIPNGMVHSVLNLDDTIAVAAHFASTQNLEMVWNTIVGLGSDKHWQQAYFSGILDREQRRFVRNVSGSWPPKPGDMYFYDGPFLQPKKRQRQTDSQAETEHFDDYDDSYDDDDYDVIDDDEIEEDEQYGSFDDDDAYDDDDDDDDGFVDDDEIEEDEPY